MEGAEEAVLMNYKCYNNGYKIDDYKMNLILAELKRQNKKYIVKGYKDKPHTKPTKKPKKSKTANNRAKGNKFVNEAMAEYTQNGWLCWKPGNKAVFIPGIRKVVSASQDILTVADFLAIKPDDKIHFVQVTTATQAHETSLAKKRRDKMDDIPFNMEHCVLIVMARKRGGEWRVWRKDTLGWAEIALYAHNSVMA